MTWGGHLVKGSGQAVLNPAAMDPGLRRTAGPEAAAYAVANYTNNKNVTMVVSINF